MTLTPVSRPLPPAATGAAATPEAVRRMAEEFEAMLLAQMLAGLFRGTGGTLNVDGPEGEVSGGLLREAYAKRLSRSGGIGRADELRHEMLRLQEVA
jgi:peptidoglycan hydrolase FlgJ